MPEIDVRSDIAIVYGAGDRPGMTFEERVQSWRDRGYQTAFMTGIAWGQYDDYFLGKWDGKNHLGDGQVTQQGDTIWHGKNIPYVVPVASFIEYMKKGVVKKVIDAGITSIFLEEPEFWARAGYSAAFKDEWQDYKQNYQATFTAKLLYPMVADYEVMPWPERIYTHPYKLANSAEKALIPRHYSTQMQVMVNALNHMPVSGNRVSGSKGIGVIMGNSLMFQRFPTHDGYEDPQFSNFYGQTFPLLKLGVPVETVHMENLSYEATLKDIRLLIVSYSNMKPMSAQVHQYLADWVKRGGVLVYCGRDDDPYQRIMEWWNTGVNKFNAPSEHLFQLLNIKPSSGDQKFKVGKGVVYVVRKNPKEFVIEQGADTQFVELVKQLYENDAKAGKLVYKNSLYLERGPYDIVSVLDESISNEPYIINGPVIDLFDPQLPVLSKKIIAPGEQALLYNLKRVKDKRRPQVLASASRIYDEKVSTNEYEFFSKSPSKTSNSIRILLPAAPRETLLTDRYGKNLADVKTSWDTASQTYFLSFENDPDGTKVKINW